METINLLIQYISQGGSAAVIGVLVTIIAALVWDRKDLVKILTATTQRVYDAKDSEKKVILDIVDKYYQGNSTVTQTLQEIKTVLMIIQSKV